MSYGESLEQHYRRNWGVGRKLQWSKGPVWELPDDFQVMVFRRTDQTLAYATSGMSQPGELRRIELHMICPAQFQGSADRQIVELLTAVAHYHRTGSALGLGDTVNFGRSWLGSS